MIWRSLSTPPRDGAVNMAADVWLMERARRTGESVLRTYTWRRPTLSLGRNQRAAGGYDLARIEKLGLDVVRRPTGGRAILHWRELTYSVTAPTDGLASVAHEHDRINALLLEALRTLGVTAEPMMEGGATGSPGLRPCFSDPGPGELVVRTAGRVAKLVGSAQYRENGALLQHGSILLHDDQPLLEEITNGQAADTRAAALSDLLGREVAPKEVEGALSAALCAHAGSSVAPLEYDAIEAGVEKGAAAFRDPLWTWRR